MTNKKDTKSITRLNNGIWLYFFLLIFEGALRKWLLPGLAAPLLIIRDPLALYILLNSWHNDLLKANTYLTGMILIGFISFFTAIFLGHGSLPVAIFGARILLLQFPLIFVIGKIFNREDVLQMGKVILWICLPMTLLIALQFYSPQSAWVNRGIGGVVEENGFQGALGHFRPPGTFSFVTGTYLFYGLAACFIVYFWLTGKNVNRVLLISSTLAVMAAIPLSISRTLFFEICITVFFAFIGVSQKPKYLGKMILTVVIAFVALAILSKTSFFQGATETFFARFTNASETEGGLQGTLGDRFLGGLVSAIAGSVDLPFFGYGLGMGTNVGSQLMAGGRKFLLHEEEWGRIIDELGPILGLAVILLRVGLIIKIAKACFKKLHDGQMLPWLLLSFGFLQVAQGNWAQPTSLGFCTLIGGLMLASLRMSPSQVNVSIKENNFSVKFSNKSFSYN